MHRIEIDDDVYAELERYVKGFEQPNDVLRRLLLKDNTTLSSVDATAGRKGKLLPLIEGGLIKPDDKLKHEQTRKGNVFEATVTESGWLSTNKGLYQAPSPALVDLVGSQIDGWANWLHVPSGKTLRQLRFQLQQRKGSDV
jgi:Restriction Enzyme Adenine Methylase Associated